MECLDEETILAFCRGDLAEEARVRAQEHLGECDECRVLVSAVMRSSFAEGEAPPSREHEAPPESDPDARSPGPLLRRIDPAMAATTPVGGGAHGPAISPVQPGEILAGKYQVERVLGAGGMGIVVAARHTQLEQRVALKFLLPVACEVPGAVARFLREGKAAARITSEHVARVMDTGVLDVGAPYLVMEYLEGSDLGAVVERRGRLPADEAIEYVLQACEAIVEAHDLGIVHRDLKPANLFLSRRADGSPLVKVLDFGISKVEGSGSRSQLTSASVLMGSPRYMSPEQMMSAKDVDARTDVWALGVILYELVCGKPVWQADTVQGLCALIASAPAPKLRALAPDAPAVLEDVVARCLTKSLGVRLASVAELALALEPIAPASARTSIERILRVARRGRGASAQPGGGPGDAQSRRPEELRSGPPAEAQRGRSADGPGASGARTADAGALQPAITASATTLDAARGGSGRVGLVLAVGVAALLVVGIAVNASLGGRPRELPAAGGPGASGAGASTGAVAASAAPVVSASVAAVVGEGGGQAAGGSAPPAVAPPAVASPAVASPASSAHRSLRAPAVGSAAPGGVGAASAPPALSPPGVAPDRVAPADSSRALTDRK